jgi:transposase
MEKKIIQRSGRFYNISERHMIIQEYLSGYFTKQGIWKKYTGQDVEHGELTRWMRELGYTSEKANITIKSDLMPKKKSRERPDEAFENQQLKKRVSELEKQLKEAELKAIAFSTMVDIAEKEFNIPIRKKLNTKP